MRTVALLVSLLVTGAAFAGCFGSEEDDPQTASIDPTTDTGTGVGTVAPPEGGLKVLAPLFPTITTDAPAWVKSGTKVSVTGAASSNAKGDVTYTWATGPLPGTAEVASAALDTKLFEAGKEKKLKFDAAGVYSMHCHPHPYMLSNVTVVEGFAGPSEAVVYITDGATQGEYRFIPENVVIPVGGTVAYRNVGTQAHTATQSGQEPALKKADLAATSGELTVEGDGWQRIVLITQDADGRIGFAAHNIYVTPELPKFETKEIAGKFTTGTPAGTPSQVPRESATESIKFEHGGKLTLNFTATDPTAAANPPAETSKIEIHLKENGATQDTLTLDAASAGSGTATVSAGTYTLTITPTQGASIEYAVTIEVVYDLVPPEPAMPAAGGGHADHGGGGGHQH